MGALDKIIITCAVTGVVPTKAQCPAVPYTAEEISEASYKREIEKHTTIAIGMGGLVRVGLEGNLHLPDGQMVKSNGALVACAAKIAASPSEAQQLLGLA